MKRFLFLTLTLLSVLALATGCQEPENTDPTNYTLKVNPQDVILSAAGGSQDVQVSTDAPTWSAKASDSWIQTAVSGNILTITAGENSSKESRKGTVKVQVENVSVDVSVLQSGKSDRPEDDPYPQYEYGLADKTVFVPADVCKAITAADPAAHTFTIPTSGAGSVQMEPGWKLIMNTPTALFPDGLLVEVTAVSQSGGNYVVTYRDLKLEEAFTNLRIDETDLDLSAHLEKILDADGHEISFTRTRSVDQRTFHIEIPAAAWPLGVAGLEITPIMDAYMTMTLQAIVADAKMYIFNMNVETDLLIGATLAMGAEGKVIDDRRPLFSMIFSAIPVGPVLVTPFVEIAAVYYVSGKVSIEATAKFHTVQTQGVHYDVNSGWSANDFSGRNKAGTWEELSVSPKLEGSVAYGLGVGPFVGVYGKVVAAGVSFDTLIKESVSEAFNLLDGDPSRYLDWDFTKHLQNIEYTNSVVGVASLNVELVGMPAASLDTPEFTISTHSRKIIPSVDDDTFSFNRTDAGMELTIDVKNPHLLTGSVYALFKEHSAAPASTARKVNFLNSRSALAELNAGEKSVTLKATAELEEEDPDLLYADIMLSTPDLSDPICLASLEMAFDDTEARAALLKILADIYVCRDGEWEGCNWFDLNRPVVTMKNVRVSYRGGAFKYTITLPADWKIGKNFSVGNRSEGATRFGSWEIVFQDGTDAAIESFSVQDVHFLKATMANTTATYFNVNSPLWGQDQVATIPAAVTILDLSGTAVTDIESARIGANLSDVVLTGCKQLKTLTLGPASAPNVPKLLYTATGCDALETITLRHLDFTQDYFLHNERGNGKAELIIDGCKLEDNDFPGLFPSVRIANSTFGVLGFQDNKVTESIDLRDSKGKGLLVKKCAKMRSITCPDTGISSFTVEELPEMIHIDVENNENLLAMVPDVFDQIADGGGTVRYDIRYTYEDTGTGVITYVDNGYGFWYEGEPGCGYHGKVPPGEDDEGYVTHPGESASRAAFRKILQDLYRCRKGEWEDCDWLDGSKPLSSLKNVTAPENESNKETYYVTIPEEWQFGPDVLVKKHNKQPNGNYGGEEGHYEDWVLQVRGERTYNSFTVSDPRCYILVVKGEAGTFAVHSPSFFFQARGSTPYKYRSHEIPSKIHTLDLRGCGSYELDYTWDYEHMPKVIKMRRYDGSDDGSNPRVYIKFTDAAPQPMPTIEIEGVSYRISVTNAQLPYGALPVKVDHLEGLCLYSCPGDLVYAPENVDYLAVGQEAGSTVNYMPYASGVAPVKQVVVQDHKTIKGISARVQESVTVTSCPAIRNIVGYAEYSFTVRSCPEADYISVSTRDLTIKDCKKLKSMYYPDDYGPVENVLIENCAALESVEFQRNNGLRTINMSDVPALTFVDLRQCTGLTMVVPAFFQEVWGQNGTIHYEQRYTYTYGSGPYTTALGEKFNYTDKGYGFYFEGEPNRGYHRNVH